MSPELFEDRTRLKDLILRILKEESSASISGIQERLEKHGHKLHRLIVTGYLRALADAGFLEEQEIPPSKVYRLKAGEKQRDLYDVAGRLIAARTLPRGQEAQVLVALLSRLFHRPIFKQEIQSAQLEPLGIAEWEVETKDRQSARQRLVQAGFELPHNNPAYLPPSPLPDGLRALSDELLAELVVHGFQASQYVLRGRQVTLSGM